MLTARIGRWIGSPHAMLPWLRPWAPGTAGCRLRSAGRPGRARTCLGVVRGEDPQSGREQEPVRAAPRGTGERCRRLVKTDPRRVLVTGGTGGACSERYLRTVRRFSPVSRAISETVIEPDWCRARKRRSSNQRCGSKATLSRLSRIQQDTRKTADHHLTTRQRPEHVHWVCRTSCDDRAVVGSAVVGLAATVPSRVG